MAEIDRDFLDTLRHSIDLAELVSEHVSLRRRGSEFVGLCPFHDERTPSFTVSADKQLFHCFGCGAGGDALTFTMKLEGLEFPEAVRSLAARAGLELPSDEDPAAAERRRRRQGLLEVMELAARYFESALWKTEAGAVARQYLERRGIEQELAQRFQLGYAMPSWNGLLRALGRRGVSGSQLERAGLVGGDERGDRRYDRFRHRLIFPIWDATGRVVAFGGRQLADERGPKYINSPETELFKKGTLWYGLHLARAAARRQGLMVAVEGYMDVMACHAHGFDNVVASMGTALSRDQAWSLARVVPAITMAYDADAAGTEATLRSLDVFHETGIAAAVAVLPAGTDPDDLLRQRGAEAWQEAVAGAVPLLSFRVQVALSRHPELTTDAKVAVVRELTPALLALGDDIRLSEGIRQLAERLQLSERAIRGDLARAARRSGRRRQARQLATATGTGGEATLEQVLSLPPAVRKAERRIIRLLMDDPRRFAATRGDAAADVEPLAPDHFTEPSLRAVFAAIEASAAGGAQFRPGDVMAGLDSEEVKRELSGVLLEDFGPGDPKRTLRDCVATLISYRTREAIGRLQADVAAAEREGRAPEVATIVELARLQACLERLRRRY